MSWCNGVVMWLTNETFNCSLATGSQPADLTVATAMHERTNAKREQRSAPLLQRGVSLRAGSEGQRSERPEALQPNSRLTAKSSYASFALKVSQRGRARRRKRTDRVRSNKEFSSRSDVSLRLHRRCSSSGCCGQMLLRTHKRDGWPLTGQGKTQVNFSGFLWRLGVLGRWWRWPWGWGFTRVEFTLWSPSGSRVHDSPSLLNKRVFVLPLIWQALCFPPTVWPHFGLFSLLLFQS